MQVSKWLGHATFTLTLDTYGDYITADKGGKAAPLARPVITEPKQTANNNVVTLQRKSRLALFLVNLFIAREYSGIRQQRQPETDVKTTYGNLIAYCISRTGYMQYPAGEK